MAKNYRGIICAMAFCCAIHTLPAQVLLGGVGGYYFQDFGTTAQASSAGSWTDNSTYTGWFVDDYTRYQGTIDITNAAPTNAGGQYMYTINGGTNYMLGTRPSDGSAGGPCSEPCSNTDAGHSLGLELKNTLGGAVVGMQVDFDYYQLSLADNNGNANDNFFSYQVSGSAFADCYNGSYTNVAGLNYSAIVSSNTCCSTQLNGYPATKTGHKTLCFPVSVPQNSYIMLQWLDPNDPNNDPHFAIDNVAVTVFANNVCTAYILPVELLNFIAEREKKNVNVSWTTASQTNNDYFTIERSTGVDGFTPVGTVKGAGTVTKPIDYSFTDINAPAVVCYYRLKQTDYNGKFTYSKVIRVSALDAFNLEAVYPNPVADNLNVFVSQEGNQNYRISLTDSKGATVYSDTRELEGKSAHIIMDMSPLPKGIYLLTVAGETQTIRRKIVRN